jgi:hypothetical protein
MMKLHCMHKVLRENCEFCRLTLNRIEKRRRTITECSRLEIPEERQTDLIDWSFVKRTTTSPRGYTRW